MLSKVTHGTSKDSMIFVATVVLPDALPPQIPEMKLVIPLNSLLGNISKYILCYQPITKGSTCCPAELYHGGLPAVYIVLVLLLRMDSAEVFLLDCVKLVVRCLLDLGDL